MNHFSFARRSGRVLRGRCHRHCIRAGVVALLCVATVSADDGVPAAEAVSAESPAGLLPVPDYSGDLWSRSTLTGDWGGTRTDLANAGVQLDLSFTQYVQGVTSGGRETGARYGGSLDYLFNLDLMRMGVLPGALLTVRAETRFGEAANDIAGSVLPVNTEGFFPLAGPPDEDIAITVTTLRYTQFLSEKFGAFVGKFDTLENTNEFAGGRGVSQFMNGQFVFPPTGALSVPYATLGAGVVVIPMPNLTVTSLVMNTSDSSTTTGFGDFGEGWTWLTSAQYQYRLGELPGGIGAAFAYAADNEFKEVAGGLVFVRGEGLSVVRDDETWFASVDAWQYLWVADESDKLIDVANGQQDRRGIGVFARLGFGDKDTNPIEFTVAGGVAAKGLIPTRERDTLGVGYAYTILQESRLSGILGIEDHVQAFEAYYNLAVTPAVGLTFDVQLIDPASSRVDPAVVLGARLNIRF